MKRSLMLAAAAVALGACSHSYVQTASAPGYIYVQPADASMLPMGTDMVVRLDTPIGSATSHVGDVINATVLSDLLAKNNAVAVPAGAMLWGHVIGLRTASNPDYSFVRIAFDSLDFNNSMHWYHGNVKSVAVTKTVPQTVQPIGGVEQPDVTTPQISGVALGAVVTGAELNHYLGMGGWIGDKEGGTVVALGNGTTTEELIPAGTMVTVTTNRDVYLR